MFFGVSTHLGGAERSLLDFLKLYNRDPKRSDFFVLLPKSDGPFIELLEQNRIAYKILPMPPWVLKLTRQKFLGGLSPEAMSLAPLSYLRDLIRVIREQNVDTVHCTGIKCHVAAAMISPFIKARVIVHFRDIIKPKPLAQFFGLFKLKKNIEWLAASRAIAEAMTLVKPRVIYDGFDDRAFAPERTTFLKDHFRIPETAPLIGLVGVLTPWKGQKEFLLAAQATAAKHPAAHFVIVGDPIYDTATDENFLEELKALRKAAGLIDRFHFLGFQKNTAPIYNSLDWLVHASTRPEPFGRVVVEAQLCKTPVIASGAGGILEIIRDGETGLLHKPGDVASLAATLDKALNLSTLEKARLAQKAYEFCKTAYPLEARYEELKDILENR